MSGACFDAIPTGIAVATVLVAAVLGALAGVLITATNELRDQKAGGVSTSSAGSRRPSPKEG